uniref:Apple domain-containing protein n=1 Tax=Alexandrium monilatum TaxID=311494 RepID=A0A7S4W758_9DINO|mmetsp:Transcript_30258/g.95507  ORF Transcript_30258/g.95507 Transcript_30258/m.95507 type:complete len:469 (-) Transcript_30258:41-1447(-)
MASLETEEEGRLLGIGLEDPNDLSHARFASTVSNVRRFWLAMPNSVQRLALLSLGSLCMAALAAACYGAAGRGRWPASSLSLGDGVLLASKTCSWRHHSGHLIPGFNMDLYKHETPTSCMQRCEANHRCKAVEYAVEGKNAGWDEGNVFKPGFCFLQSTAEGMRDYSRITGYKNVDLYVKESCRPENEASEDRRTTSSSSTSSSSRLPIERTSTTPRPSTPTTTPCAPHKILDAPSVFCFSVMTPGPEVALVQSQLAKRASIFSCNDFAVISVANMSLGKDSCGKDVWTWYNPSLRSVPMGTLDFSHGVTTNSWLNTGTFINAWDMLMKSPNIWHHAWILKADPDAVLLADRVRQHMAPHSGPSYVLNCNFEGQMKIFGAVEVFSVPAISAYKQRPWLCKNLPWHGWGEDMYMQKCMEALGIPSVVDLNLVGDARCQYRPCQDGGVAAFHPFKDVGGYWNCWGMAVGR